MLINTILLQLLRAKRLSKNLSDIERLNGELQSLARFGRQELLYLDPAQAEKAAEYKSRYETLTRRKKQLWAKYYSIKIMPKELMPQRRRILMRYYSFP